MAKRLSITRCALVLLLTIIAEWCFAQDYHIKGRITDERNRQPLAFVNVVVNGGVAGGMSDIDGKYDISCKEPIASIRFSYIGYQSYETAVRQGSERLNVALTPISFELTEVTVDAGENPAHRIIDSVMAHRRENNPDNLQAYTYSMYDKMAFTIDSTALGKQRSDSTYEIDDVSGLFSKILDRNDLMVMETSSDVFFMAPDHKQQNVTGTKIAGTKDPTFVYLVSEMQSISFYDDEVNIMGTKYVNPLSKGSKSRYFFNIESVTAIGNGDSLYTVSFHPYKGSSFDGLTGSLSINSDGWAVQSVKASPDTKGGMFTVNIQQLYEKTDGQWFPKQLNTNLVFPSIGIPCENGFLPMAAIGKSYLTDIRINPELDKKMFSELAVEVDPDAAYRDDTFWTSHRIDSLSQRTIATYAFMDSLTQGNDLFDRLLTMTDEIMESSAIPMGKISLDIDNTLRYSFYRGFRFGLGFSTNDRLSRVISFNATAGYWTRMNRWDYAAGFNLNLYRRKQTELSFKAFCVSDELGEFNDLQDGYSILSQRDYKFEYFENIYVWKEGGSAELSSRFGRYFKGFAKFEIAHKQYLEDFFIINNHENHPRENNFAIAELRLRYQYKEKFISTPRGLQSLGSTYPMIWFAYQHSFKGVFGSPFEYDRFKFQIEKHFYTRYMGVSNILFQAGYVTKGAPVEETFDILATYSKARLYAPESFNAMRPEEFFCDRFVALFLSHNFSGMLWQPNSTWFKPELTLITNIGWGTMKRDDMDDYNFKTMEKGYFESGIIVEGLLALPLMKLGGGVFYRYGPYAFDNVWSNFALKWSVIFDI